MTDDDHDPGNGDPGNSATVNGGTIDGRTVDGEPTSSSSSDIEAAVSAASPLPFEQLQAPLPTPAAPPAPARWLGFASILVGGLLGGLIGYGTADLMADSSVIAAAGGLIGALVCAIGVGIVASLTLRAMGEWQSVRHPEAE